MSYLIEVRGLKLYPRPRILHSQTSYLIEVRGLKHVSIRDRIVTIGRTLQRYVD